MACIDISNHLCYSTSICTSNQNQKQIFFCYLPLSLELKKPSTSTSQSMPLLTQEPEEYSSIRSLQRNINYQLETYQDQFESETQMEQIIRKDLLQLFPPHHLFHQTLIIFTTIYSLLRQLMLSLICFTYITSPLFTITLTCPDIYH